MQVTNLIKKISFFTGSLILLLSSCQKNQMETGFFDEDILSISTFLDANSENFSKFLKIVQQTDLYSTLNAINPNGIGYTLFLPTDEAFERYVEDSDKYDSFDALVDDFEFSRLLVLYHLVNTKILTSDFPYGALSDSTSSGDYLTVGIEITEETASYMINNSAPVIAKDIETANGVIQVINEVLEPISFNSYEWLVNKEGFTILSKALEITGLKDTMDILKYTASGQLVKNEFTVLAEHDSIFLRNGISTIEDLIEKYHTPGYELDDPDGGLYQFAAYHILEGRHYLDAFTDGNYNTYAFYPISVGVKIDIKINPGVDSFRFEINGADTVLINYIGIFYQESNVNTKNGPVHFITEVMELFKPKRATEIFQFLEDPLINGYSKNSGTYDIVDPDLLEKLWWEGPEVMVYVKGNEGANKANRNDYLELQGLFRITYVIPKILPGRYRAEIRTDAIGYDNATINVKIDGKGMGGNIDLTTGGTSANPFQYSNIGIVEFTRFETHLIEISSLIPGTLQWDLVRFTPE